MLQGAVDRSAAEARPPAPEACLSCTPHAAGAQRANAPVRDAVAKTGTRSALGARAEEAGMSPVRASLTNLLDPPPATLVSLRGLPADQRAGGCKAIHTVLTTCGYPSHDRVVRIPSSRHPSQPARPTSDRVIRVVVGKPQPVRHLSRSDIRLPSQMRYVMSCPSAAASATAARCQAGT